MSKVILIDLNNNNCNIPKIYSESNQNCIANSNNPSTDSSGQFYGTLVIFPINSTKIYSVDPTDTGPFYSGIDPFYGTPIVYAEVGGPLNSNGMLCNGI